MIEPDFCHRRLVTVAIPTFNRSGLLRRALESVLSQDYERLEVLVGDNASEDDTHLVRQEIGSDGRVRWMLRETNLGALSNFEALVQEARGHYFMWLADDDFLSHDYISRCVKRLSEPDSPRQVMGRAVFRRDEIVVREESIQYVDVSPSARVLSLYRSVKGNPFFYSMSTTDDMKEVLPFMSGVSFDWVHVARHLVLGSAECLNDVTVFIGVKGGDEMAQPEVSIGPDWHQQAYKMFYLAHDAAKDICSHPAYAELRSGQRRALAIQCAFVTFIRGCSRQNLICAAAMSLKRYLPEGTYSWLQRTWRRRPGHFRLSSSQTT